MPTSYNRKVGGTNKGRVRAISYQLTPKQYLEDRRNPAPVLSAPQRERGGAVGGGEGAEQVRENPGGSPGAQTIPAFSNNGSYLGTCRLGEKRISRAGNLSCGCVPIDTGPSLRYYVLLYCHCNFRRDSKPTSKVTHCTFGQTYKGPYPLCSNKTHDRY